MLPVMNSTIEIDETGRARVDQSGNIALATPANLMHRRTKTKGGVEGVKRKKESGFEKRRGRRKSDARGRRRGREDTLLPPVTLTIKTTRIKAKTDAVIGSIVGRAKRGKGGSPSQGRKIDLLLWKRWPRSRGRKRRRKLRWDRCCRVNRLK